MDFTNQVNTELPTRKAFYVPFINELCFVIPTNLLLQKIC